MAVGASLGMLALACLAATGSMPTTVLFFFGDGCPHCEEAAPFVEALEREHACEVERFEIRRNAAGRERFLMEVRRLEISAPGIPLFVVGDRYLVGFRAGVTEPALRRLIAGGDPGTELHLPGLGRIVPGSGSFLGFTVLVGLVDGINPCAMYVLFVLLGILSRVRSRARLVLFGATFVVTSGVVYFLFMTVWAELFALVGLSRFVARALGFVLVVMGLLNLKETIWWKHGPSLMIPERAKPGLFRRMRQIAQAGDAWAAFVGILALAFLVNLVELGCTLGLPAAYTRLLTTRADVGPLGRAGYLALYNMAYVVPLGLIVAVYALTLRKLALSRRGAQGLKLVSGILLLVFGLWFAIDPGLVS